MALVAKRRFLSHEGGRHKFYEVGEEVPADVAAAADPALIEESGADAAPSDVDGSEERTLSAGSLA